MHEYMDDLGKFSKTSLLVKEDFYSHLNMKDIHAEYTHAKRAYKEFEKRFLGNIMICMFKVIHCCYLVYLKPFRIYVFKYMG